jgi:hypothetical protein
MEKSAKMLHYFGLDCGMFKDQIFKIKSKNQKPIAVDVLFKAYPMVLLSGLI